MTAIRIDLGKLEEAAKADKSHADRLRDYKLSAAQNMLTHIANAVAGHKAASRGPRHLRGHKITVSVPHPHKPNGQMDWRVRPVNRTEWHGGNPLHDDPDVNGPDSLRHRAKGAMQRTRRGLMTRAHYIQVPFHDPAQGTTRHHDGKTPLHQVAGVLHRATTHTQSVHAMAYHMEKHGMFHNMENEYAQAHQITLKGKGHKIGRPPRVRLRDHDHD